MEIKITVERRRGSVTQGTAVVLINGTPAATFGDNIELIKPGEKYYGELIGGWASKTPDTDFILGILTHPHEQIYRLCEKAVNIIKAEKEREEENANIKVTTQLEDMAIKHGWPMKIQARGEVATLVGTQTLIGRIEPVYRFPGGDSLVSRSEMIPYEEEQR